MRKLELLALPDSTLLLIACAGSTSATLGRLGLTCRRFGSKTTCDEKEEPLSLVEQAARKWLLGLAEEQRRWVPRRGAESWMALMREAEMLRQPLVFGRSNSEVTLLEGGAVARRSKAEAHTGRTAVTNTTMRAGRHFAQVVLDGLLMGFGIFRPWMDVENGKDLFAADGNCVLHTASGRYFPGFRSWKGMCSLEAGDVIGLLLDLDQGSLTVYRNGERVGIMVAEGLAGEYCWGVSLCLPQVSARIQSAPAPPSPTADELAGTIAWQKTATTEKC
jgi:hypothetical protein